MHAYIDTYIRAHMVHEHAHNTHALIHTHIHETYMEHTFIHTSIHRCTRLVACPLRLPDARRGWQTKFGCGPRPMEDDLVAPAAAHLEELAATADPGDHGVGLAATADPNRDIDTGGLSACSDSDSDDEFSYWRGSADDWPEIYSVALGFANPLRRSDETSKQSVATIFAGTDGVGLAATADRNRDIDLGGLSACSDDDSDDGFSYWTGSGDNWPNIYRAALRLANPLRRSNETSKLRVATTFAGTDAPSSASQSVPCGELGPTCA